MAKVTCPKCGASLRVLLYPLDKRGIERLEEVFFGIIELKKPSVDFILNAELTEHVNKGKAPRDRYTNKEVSKLAKILGFTTRHVNRGTAIICDDATVKKARQSLGKMRMTV